MVSSVTLGLLLTPADTTASNYGAMNAAGEH